MTQQYLRKVSLGTASSTGVTVDLSQMHFKYRVQRGDIQTPNTADIRIYNLSSTTINTLTKQLSNTEYLSVTLQAGYEGQYGVIFQGTVKQLRQGRENATDTYLEIRAADGDGAYNFAVVNVSLAAGSTPEQQVAAIIANMDASYGITAGSITISGPPLPRGKVMFGLMRDHMRKIADTYQTSWSIQNGQVNMVPLNNFIPNTTVAINSATGMIGLPEQTQQGIRVRCLLNPNIKIGGSIQLNNASIQQYPFPLGVPSAAANLALIQSIHTNADGYYKVLWVDYIGDTRGQEWYSEIISIAIDAVQGQSTLGKNTTLGPSGPIPPVQPYAPSQPFPGQN